MKKKVLKRTPETVFSTEQEYWDYYAKRSLTYKTLDLHKWKEHFQGVLLRDPTNQMAQSMLKRCVEEEKVLIGLKEEQNKKNDESLLVKEQYSSRRSKK